MEQDQNRKHSDLSSPSDNFHNADCEEGSNKQPPEQGNQHVEQELVSSHGDIRRVIEIIASIFLSIQCGLLTALNHTIWAVWCGCLASIIAFELIRDIISKRYSSHTKWIRLCFVLAIISVVGISVNWTWSITHSKQLPSVSPNRITLAGTLGFLENEITVKNPFDYPLYNVSILIEVNGDGVLASSLAIIADKLPFRPEENLPNNITVFPDFIRLDCVRTSDGKQIVEFILFTVPANTYRNLRITGGTLTNSYAQLSIAGFDTNQNAIIKYSDNRTAFPFHKFVDAACYSMQPGTIKKTE